MQKSTFIRRNGFKFATLALAALLAIGGSAAFLAGVTPTRVATLAHDPETQVAVFMVPLTLLMVAMLFEATRVALRGKLPAELPSRRKSRPSLSTDRFD